MSLIVQIDDIELGDNLASLNGSQIAHSQRTLMSSHRASIAAKHLPNGTPVKVIALNRPFAMCAIVEPGGVCSELQIVDLREMQFCRLSEEFMKKLCGESSSNDGQQNIDDIPF